jgi:hypothetical protein
MDKKAKAGPKIADITGKIVALLEPLSAEDRHKVINASLTLLGETPGSEGPAGGAPSGTHRSDDRTDRPGQKLEGVSAKGAGWIRQNGLATAQVEQVFDIESGDIIVSEAPGKSDKEKTHNAYVLLGISRLLASGDAAFDDKTARKLCENLGCYNKANHSVYMGDKGNVITGSKDKGWKLTGPGLKRGADLVKQLAKEA